MTIKQLYSYDLINRNPGYTFSETPVLDKTLVEFKDGGSTVVASAKKLDIDDAYRSIREDQVGDSSILAKVSEAQRDALTGSMEGQTIFNTDGAGEVYISSSWTPL